MPSSADEPSVRLRSNEWRLAGVAGVALGVVVAVVAVSNWTEQRSFIDIFFAAVGVGIAVTGLMLSVSSVELTPGYVVIVNGWRRRVFELDEVDGVSIVGIGDRRGAEAGQPPPRATWVVQIETLRGPIIAFGLMANRKDVNRERLRDEVERIARHCGLL
jgi:hypothetical protein